MALQRSAYLLNLAIVIRLAMRGSPDDSGPADVLALSTYYMYMQLVNDISDACDVEFFAGKVQFDKNGQGIDGEQQILLVAGIEFEKLSVCAMRNQYQPGEISIVQEQQFGPAELAEWVAVCREARIQGKRGHCL